MVHKRTFFVFSLVLTVFFCGITGSVFAQSIDDFSISANPEFPKELGETVISITSYSTNLTTSKIVWKENGVVVAQEYGLQERSFTAPRNGSSKTITVEATTQSGLKIAKDYILAPQSMDLLWEAVDSYVPPFYKGKALAGEQSLVKVVAIPNFTSRGALLDRTQTVFTWSVGGRQPDGVSGYNKPSLVFKFSPIKNGETVKVLAESLNGNSQTEDAVSLRPVATDIVFYEASPLLGTLYERAFTRGLRLISNEITLVAEPYFFSAGQNSTSNTTYAWGVDGNSVNPGSDKTRITLRNPGKSGKATISVAVKHIEKTLQNLTRSIPIVYEN